LKSVSIYVFQNKHRSGLSFYYLLLSIISAGCTPSRSEVRELPGPSAVPTGLTIAAKGSQARPPVPSQAPIDEILRTSGSSIISESQGDEARSKQSTNLPPAIEAAMPVSNVAPGGPIEGSVSSYPDVQELEAIAAAGRPLSLPEAIGLAFQSQPRLRAQLESIAQARGRQEIVMSTFFPVVKGNYDVGGYSLGVGGHPIQIGGKSTSGFNVIPGFGAVPVGLGVSTGFELAELKAQWLIADFGRRLGRLEQSKLALDVANLQTERAYQTVANEVASAYYSVLRAQAFRATAMDASRRAEEQLGDARKLEREGVVNREIVLRAEVLLSETRQQIHAATELEFVALAELGLSIGSKCNEPLRVLDTQDVPPFNYRLVDCLQVATQNRREFHVAQRAIQIAQEGTRVAKAEFAPKIIADGSLVNLQQSSPSGFADFAVGFIRLEWDLFEGGRKISEKRVADSRVREAMANAESVVDTITFQVNEAYRRLATAGASIEDARPAVDQARENYRLVRLRALEGNATPVEITDAQASLTRAQQTYQNAVYSYLTAISRLEYAMGNSPTPLTLKARHHHHGPNS
jgi:outer membrane protein